MVPHRKVLIPARKVSTNALDDSALTPISTKDEEVLVFAAIGETINTNPTPLSFRKPPSPQDHDGNLYIERQESDEGAHPAPVWRDFSADHPLNSDVNIQNI